MRETSTQMGERKVEGDLVEAGLVDRPVVLAASKVAVQVRPVGKRQIALVAPQHGTVRVVIVFPGAKVFGELNASGAGDPAEAAVPSRGRGQRIEIAASAWPVPLDAPVADGPLNAGRHPFGKR